MPLEATTTVQWIGIPEQDWIYILVTHVSTWQRHPETWRARGGIWKLEMV